MRDWLEELWAAAAELLPEEEMEAAPLAPAVSAPRRAGRGRRKREAEETRSSASPARGTEQARESRGWQAAEDEAGPLPEELFLPGEEETWPDFTPEEGGAGMGEGWRRPSSGGQARTTGRMVGEALVETAEGAVRYPAAPAQAGRGNVPFLQEQARRLRAAAELSRALGSRGQGGAAGGESAGGLSELLLTGGSGPGAVRTVQSAREVDRLFQRDARRYDGAFFLY